MNDTFEDRLWSVLVDEVRSPSLPSFDEPTTVGAPAPKRGRTPMLVAGGIAAALALLGGVLALAVDDDVSSVETADTPSTTIALDLPYLTFADPVGGVVQRVSQARNDRPPRLFRRIDAAPGPSDISLTPSDAFPNLDAFNVVGTAGGIVLRELDPSNSGGVPMNMYYFDAPDGSSWMASGWGYDAVDLGEVSALVESLQFSSGQVSVSPPFREFTTPVGSPTAWAIQDGQATALAFRDSTSDISDLPGEPVTVRGHEGREKDNTLTWRETPDLVIEIVSSLQTMTGSGTTPISPEDRRAAAERLVPDTQAGYEALPVWRGMADSNVLVLQAPGRQVNMVDFWAVDAEGKQLGNGGGSLGDLGSALPFLHDAAEIWIWNGDRIPGVSTGTQPIRTGPPACAQHVVVPAAGQPPVEVTIDPDCRG